MSGEKREVGQQVSAVAGAVNNPYFTLILPEKFVLPGTLVFLAFFFLPLGDAISWLIDRFTKCKVIDEPQNGNLDCSTGLQEFHDSR